MRLLPSALLVPLALAVTATSCKRDSATVAPVPVGGAASAWKLVWADEFDMDGPPNPSNWTFEVGFVRNEELQWYQPGNATCSKGLLILTARRERVVNLDYQPGATTWARRRPEAEYTSASLMTRGLHQWLYGRFEMRARIDTRGGLWPAFWTLGATGDWASDWPHGGEIDIMEYYRGTLLANAFWGSKDKWVPVSNINRFPLSAFNDPDWAKRFHVWRMDWDERQLQFCLDDKPLCRIDLDQTHNEDGTGNPLRRPQFLLLSLAVGGTQGGDPSATEFPAHFEVDYVRVFRR